MRHILFLYFSLRPISYPTSLTINITRSGFKDSNDYQYEHYYRLQADEKFAETIVQWLKSPRIVADIYKKAEIKIDNLSLRQLRKMIRAEKVSSQVVLVTFSAQNRESAKKISNSIINTISENIEALNSFQKEKNWFHIVPFEPITVTNQVSISAILFFSALVGILLAFWGVLIIHYLE